MKQSFARAWRPLVAAFTISTLAVLGFIASAPPANAFVLHDDSNSTVCNVTGAGNVQLVIYYWSWTDGSGVKWVAMKSGKHIRVDITGSGLTVLDPELVSLQRAGILYAFTDDAAGNDESATYIFGIPGSSPPQVNALDFTIDASSGMILTSNANNGINQPWLTSTGNPGETAFFLHQFKATDRPFINFEWENWSADDHGPLIGNCNLVMVNHF